MVAQTATQDLNAETPDALSDVLREYMDVAQRLQATHETLRGEVERLRRELASKDRELERRRRLAALGELAAGVAHEVRNPLGAIQLYSGLLRGEVRGRHAAEALKLIDKIETGIAAIDGVVRDTLALAPRGGRGTACSLREIIERAIDVCDGVLHDHAVTLELTLDDPQASVMGHPDGLQRVIVNLISNAAQASMPQSIVDVHAGCADGGFVSVRVSDRGTGLAPEVLDRIFDPFFTTKEQGTGLGLTIAHRLIEAHGGTLVARNRAEGGAEFTIEFPTPSDNDQTAVPPADQPGISAA